MPALSPALVPDVLPAVMPQVPAVPEFLPALPAAPALPSRVPADLPPEGRQALAAALAGPVPGTQPKTAGKVLLPDDVVPLTLDEAGVARFPGLPRSMPDRRDPRGRRLPLDYLLALRAASPAGPHRGSWPRRTRRRSAAPAGRSRTARSPRPRDGDRRRCRRRSRTSCHPPELSEPPTRHNITPSGPGGRRVRGL
jgi:hypothetical protein